MTCIVAIKSKGDVYIGGDTRALYGTVPKTLSAGKVYRIGEFVIGGSGPVRVNELVRHNFHPPSIRIIKPTSDQLDRYMNTVFISALRKLLEDNGCVGDDEEGYGEHYGGAFLIGVRSEIYLIDASFAIYRAIDDFNSVGSGSEVALGALHALETRDDGPLDKLRIALEAAERWQESVRAPFTFESTRRLVVRPQKRRKSA